jgi:hypothetical protein
MRKHNKINTAAPISLLYRRELSSLYAERLAKEFDDIERTGYEVRLLPNPVRAARGVHLKGWLNTRAKGLQRKIRKDPWSGKRKEALREIIRVADLRMPQPEAA